MKLICSATASGGPEAFELQNTAGGSGRYGGDIDLKELVAGSAIYLPVFVPGGMLVLGDCHAVVGDGAVAGTGAECSSEAHIRVTLEQSMDLAGPRAMTPDCFVVLSHGEELGPAMKQAVRDMVDFLVREKGLAPYTPTPCAAWRATCGSPAPSGPSVR